MSAGPRVVVELRVRWPDCDPAGIVHFANYFTYFEIACMDYLRHRGVDWPALYAHHGWKGFPRVGAHADYRAMGRYDDTLAAHAWVSEVARKVVTFGCAVYRRTDGVLLADGWLKAVMLGGDGRAVELPPTVADWLRGGPPPPEAVLTGDDVSQPGRLVSLAGDDSSSPGSAARS